MSVQLHGQMQSPSESPKIVIHGDNGDGSPAAIFLFSAPGYEVLHHRGVDPIEPAVTESGEIEQGL